MAQTGAYLGALKLPGPGMTGEVIFFFRDRSPAKGKSLRWEYFRNNSRDNFRESKANRGHGVNFGRSWHGISDLTKT